MSLVLGNSYRVQKANVVSRPSKIIKTPYVADVRLRNAAEEKEFLAHTPSLGCNGMVDASSTVYMIQREPKSKAKCDYTVIASEVEEKGQKLIIGVEPSLGEKLGEDILKQGVISGLAAKCVDRQFSYEDCRFDFKGITTSNEPFICEVKNVSIAVYENIRPSHMKKQDYSSRDVNSKMAIFPSGFKPKGQTHSERAVKQTKRLTEIKQKHPEVRCLILYVIQRADVETFQISLGDQIYLDTISEAVAANVEIAAVTIDWSREDDGKTITLIPRIHNPALKVSLPNNI
jgi:DNA-binding sugar fermentation-stimulating protein